MAFFPFKQPLHQNQLSYLTLCKYPSTFNPFNFHSLSHILTFSPPKHTFLHPQFLQVRTHLTHLETTPFKSQPLKPTTNRNNRESIGSGFSSSKSNDKRVEGKPVEKTINSAVEEKIEKRVTKLKQSHSRNRLYSGGRREEKDSHSGYSSKRAKVEKSVKHESKNEGSEVIRDNRMKKVSKKGKNDELGEEKKGKRGSKKNKLDLPEVKLRIGLDMCSKKGDVIGAIKLYDLAQREELKMGQYHYSVILYLCSSAATGVVQPAKSGSGNRSLSTVDPTNDGSKELGQFGKTGKVNSIINELNSRAEKQCTIEFSNEFTEQSPQTLDELIQSIQTGDESSSVKEDNGIQISEDVKKYSLQRGFEIYQKMQSENIVMNEAILTAVARMAMSVGNGDMAFDMVNQMKLLGINPRLRSYGPALSVFCNNGDIEKAFEIEEHMIQHGVYPEEPELEALLRVSVEANKSDKVYYLLHKLRTRVRKVSNSTADLIEKWFNTKTASRIGKRKWDEKLVKNATENGGGGWHGLGWLGKGKWIVNLTFINGDGLCKCCGEKLVTIDLDPIETENFAESVASTAKERERNSEFERFQKWLEYYGPFEVVVDAANVGLYNQRKFKPSKVNAIVNGIRQKLRLKKCPLIVLHNRRITGERMDDPNNKAVIEKWKTSKALYATPTGSNDDWYWLYAAIKFKCLLLTNDEMRDHLFELLGNDFFPKWKERHQVRFSFSEVGPVFHMPPPCSVVIQESEKGHWHIPIQTEQEDCEEERRSWLCITRPKSLVPGHDFPTIPKQDTPSETEVKVPALKHENQESSKHPPRTSRNQRNKMKLSALKKMIMRLENL